MAKMGLYIISILVILFITYVSSTLCRHDVNAIVYKPEHSKVVINHYNPKNDTLRQVFMCDNGYVREDINSTYHKASAFKENFMIERVCMHGHWFTGHEVNCVQDITGCPYRRVYTVEGDRAVDCYHVISQSLEGYGFWRSYKLCRRIGAKMAVLRKPEEIKHIKDNIFSRDEILRKNGDQDIPNRLWAGLAPFDNPDEVRWADGQEFESQAYNSLEDELDMSAAPSEGLNFYGFVHWSNISSASSKFELGFTSESGKLNISVVMTYWIICKQENMQPTIGLNEVPKYERILQRNQLNRYPLLNLDPTAYIFKGSSIKAGEEHHWDDTYSRVVDQIRLEPIAYAEAYPKLSPDLSANCIDGITNVFDNFCETLAPLQLIRFVMNRIITLHLIKIWSRTGLHCFAANRQVECGNRQTEILVLAASPGPSGPFTFLGFDWKVCRYFKKGAVMPAIANVGCYKPYTEQVAVYKNDLNGAITYGFGLREVQVYSTELVRSGRRNYTTIRSSSRGIGEDAVHDDDLLTVFTTNSENRQYLVMKLTEEILLDKLRIHAAGDENSDVYILTTISSLADIRQVVDNVWDICFYSYRALPPMIDIRCGRRTFTRQIAIYISDNDRAGLQLKEVYIYALGFGSKELHYYGVRLERRDSSGRFTSVGADYTEGAEGEPLKVQLNYTYSGYRLKSELIDYEETFHIGNVTTEYNRKQNINFLHATAPFRRSANLNYWKLEAKAWLRCDSNQPVILPRYYDILNFGYDSYLIVDSENYMYEVRLDQCREEKREEETMEWGEWSNSSVKCGFGVQHRYILGAGADSSPPETRLSYENCLGDGEIETIDPVRGALLEYPELIGEIMIDVEYEENRFNPRVVISLFGNTQSGDQNHASKKHNYLVIPMISFLILSNEII